MTAKNLINNSNNDLLIDSSDLWNLLETNKIPSIFLSEDYKIIKINSTAQQLLDIEGSSWTNYSITKLFTKTKFNFSNKKSRSSKSNQFKINYKHKEINGSLLKQTSKDNKVISYILTLQFNEATKKMTCPSVNLEQIVNNLPGHVYWKDKNGVLLGCNDNTLKYFGLKSRKELVGKTDYDLVNKKLADLVTKIDGEIIRTGKPKFNIEEPTFNYPNRVFLTQKVPIFNERKEVVGLIGISFDITEQKNQIEKERRILLAELNRKITGENLEYPKSDEDYVYNMLHYLENIIAVMPGNVYWKDAEGKFLGCNNNTLTHLGVKTRGEIIGKTDYDLLNKNEADYIRRIDNQVMSSNKPLLIEEQRATPCFLSYKVPLHNKVGEVIGIVGISFDISERKEQEKKLKQAKKQLEKIEKERRVLLAELNRKITGENLEHPKSYEDYVHNMLHYLENIIAVMPGNVYWKDAEGKFLGCNNNTLDYFGVKTREEVIGKTSYDLSDKKLADYISKIDNKVMSSNKPLLIEEKKSISCFLSYKVPLHNKTGEVIGMVGISFDITKQKEQEKKLKEAEIKEKLQEERIKVLQSFGACIAHELRTPLASIFNYTATQKHLDTLFHGYLLAKKNNLPVKFLRQKQITTMQDAFKDIAYETIRVNKFIDMLLTNIKSLNVDIKDTNSHKDFKINFINDCIEKALDRYAFATTTEKNLIHWNNKTNFQFYGDPILVEHILFNLIKNAIHYIKAARKGKITIEAEQKLNKNILIFMDTGQGIEKEVLPHIFDHFFSKREEGTGTGLAFCKWAMEKMKGKIYCQSIPSKFTKFTLEFPVIQE